jgi:hypothetical protein
VMAFVSAICALLIRKFITFHAAPLVESVARPPWESAKSDSSRVRPYKK